MKRNVMMAIGVAALTILLSATMAHAAVIYSENFDGPGVTLGQSVMLAPFNWFEIAPSGSYPNQRIYVGDDTTTDPNWPPRGFTGNFLDGSTANCDYQQGGGRGPYGRVGTSLTVPSDARSLILQTRGYFDLGGIGGDVIFGCGMNIGDINGVKHLIGLNVNSGGFTFSADAGVHDWGCPGASRFYNGLVTCRILMDWETNQVWCDITNGTDTEESTRSALTLTRAQVNYFGFTMDVRDSPIAPDWDDIVVTVSTPTKLTGHVIFEDFSGSNKLAPVQIQLIPVIGGAPLTEVVFLDQNNDYSITGVVAGTYNVRFSANKCLSELVSGVVVQSGSGTASPTLKNGDLNGNNAVDSTDISIAIKNLDKSGN